MDEKYDTTFGGVEAGASTILAAVLCVGFFVVTTDPIDTGGVIASVALALLGLAQVLTPRVSPWFERLSHRWVGLFWVLVGGGLAAFGVVASTTRGTLGGGLILAAAFMLYGCFVALGR